MFLTIFKGYIGEMGGGAGAGETVRVMGYEMVTGDAFDGAALDDIENDRVDLGDWPGEIACDTHCGDDFKEFLLDVWELDTLPECPLEDTELEFRVESISLMTLASVPCSRLFSRDGEKWTRRRALEDAEESAEDRELRSSVGWRGGCSKDGEAREVGDSAEKLSNVIGWVGAIDGKAPAL